MHQGRTRTLLGAICNNKEKIGWALADQQPFVTVVKKERVNYIVTIYYLCVGMPP
jgi:hypothetical protein